MNGRIDHMHHHYHVVGQHRPTQRLKHLAETRLANRLNERLDQAFSGDEQVTILRNFKMQFPLVLFAHQSDDDILKRWSEKLTGGIVKMVHSDGIDAQQRMRFNSQAHFIAQFLHDLLRDIAWQQWHYFPFIAYQHLPKAKIIQSVFRENEPHLAKLILRLQTNGDLDTILELLDEAWAQKLWQTAVLQNVAPIPTAGWRPIFSSALALLPLFGRQVPASRERLFEQFVATKTIPPDWKDHLGLAVALFDALHFLLTQLPQENGRLQKTTDSATHTKQSADTTQEQEALEQTQPLEEAQVDQALHQLDWLDTVWLKQKLLQLRQNDLNEARHKSSADNNPLQKQSTESAPPYHLPPRAKQLLQLMLDEFSSTQLAKLDQQQPFARKNGVRLFAWISRSLSQYGLPQSDDPDPLLSSLIDQTLTCWAWLAHSPLPFESVRFYLENGRFDQLPAFGDPYQAKKGHQFLNSAGQLGAKLMLQWLRIGEKGAITSRNQGSGIRDRGSLVSSQQSVEGTKNLITKKKALHNEDEVIIATQWNQPGWTGTIDTKCAGIFLLIRAMMDARLPWISNAIEFPLASGQVQFDTLLLMLGKLWAGQVGVKDGQFDDGLLFFSGSETAYSDAQLTTFWEQIPLRQHDQFSDRILRLLVGQRLVNDDVLFLHQLTLENGRSAIALGNQGEPTIWPLVAPIQDDSAHTVADLLNRWREETGRTIQTVISDQTWMTISDVGWEASTAVYEDNKAALTAALDTLQAHQNFSTLALGTASISLLKIWSRWLRQFANSSTTYLLENFIQRPGQIHVSPTEINVVMAPRSLDVVTEMAGYFASLERLFWLQDRTLKFQVGNK